MKTVISIIVTFCFVHFSLFAQDSWGALEGMSSEEMYAIEKLEEEDLSYFPGKGVEPRESFRQRVLQGILMAQAYHDHPLIVSHGRVFLELCHILGIPLIRQIPNCHLFKMAPNGNIWNAQMI